METYLADVDPIKNLYLKNAEKCYAYTLVTPSAYNVAHVYGITLFPSLRSATYNRVNFALCPVICLNSSAILEVAEDGTYNIK